MTLTRKIYQGRGEKIGDFVIGAIGGLVFNGVLYSVLTPVAAILFGWLHQEGQPIVDGGIFFLVVFLCIPLLINVGFLVILGRTRYWIALGVLTVFATLFLLIL